MVNTVKPLIRNLDHAECEAILANNQVGRLAYGRDNQVEIEPVHYVYDQGWVYGRTSMGAKVETTGHAGWPVAFEVDEFENLFSWKSVVVHGAFFTIPFNGVGPEVDEWKNGVSLLRRLVPETFAENDPFPARSILFRIQAEKLTGRAARQEESAEIA